MTFDYYKLFDHISVIRVCRSTVSRDTLNTIHYSALMLMTISIPLLLLSCLVRCTTALSAKRPLLRTSFAIILIIFLIISLLLVFFLCTLRAHPLKRFVTLFNCYDNQMRSNGVATVASSAPILHLRDINILIKIVLFTHNAITYINAAWRIFKFWSILTERIKLEIKIINKTR